LELIKTKTIHEINLIRSCNFRNMNSYGPLINEIVHEVKVQMARIVSLNYNKFSLALMRNYLIEQERLIDDKLSCRVRRVP
jgi:hypothetical protein